MRIQVVRGDITTQEVDAIVNAANQGLLGGGGVDGAIHRAAGPHLLAACRQLRQTQFPDGLPVGDAVATPGFDLPARWVIHTVGPNRYAGQNDPTLLDLAFASSLNLAVRLGARSVALPAVSAGAYGWSKEAVARSAISQARRLQSTVDTGDLDLIRFVLLPEALLQAFTRELERTHGHRSTRKAALPTIAEYLRAAVRDAIAQGRLARNTTCAQADGGLGKKLVVRVPPQARVEISPVWVQPQPGQTGPPLNSPMVFDRDRLGFFYFVENLLWSAAGAGQTSDVDQIIAQLVAAVEYDPRQSVDQASVHVGRRTDPPAVAANPGPARQPTLQIDLSGLAPAGITNLRAAVCEGLGQAAASLDPFDPYAAEPATILAHWPRDAKGRPAAGVRVLLAPLGQARFSQRQPCLVLQSARTLSDMPQFTLCVCSDFRFNFHHNWLLHPQLWTGNTGDSCVEISSLQQQCRALMQEGRLGEACLLAGVTITQDLARLLTGLPLTSGQILPVQETQAARSVLADLAPWKFGGLGRLLHADVQACRPKSPAWVLRLASHYKRRTPNVCLVLYPDGSPELGFAAVSGKNRVPIEWWSDLGEADPPSPVWA